MTKFDNEDCIVIAWYLPVVYRLYKRVLDFKAFFKFSSRYNNWLGIGDENKIFQDVPCYNNSCVDDQNWVIKILVIALKYYTSNVIY